MSVMIMEGNGEVVYILDGKLADGSLQTVRCKFAKDIQGAVVAEILDELENGRLYLGDWQKGEIQITGVVKIITNRYWTEVVYSVLFPPRQGTRPAEGTYRNIRWNSGLQCGAGALILTNDGEIVLLKSFRHAKRAWTLELPRGIRKPGESLCDCARREATEEVGAVFSSETTVTNLGVHDPDTGVITQEAEIFVFTNVTLDENRISRDVSESALSFVAVPIGTFLEMVRDGKITDGWVCSAVLRAMAYGLIRL